jgi:ABC-2 type transport system ATP-binding protein
VYISQGRIVAATSKDDFMEEFSAPGETLEDTMLRMEGEAIHA